MPDVEIVINAPYWFVLLCLLAGIAYSYFFYVFRSAYRFSFPINYLLPFFRFATVSIVAFLLLSPLLKSTQRIIEKPVIVVAHDNSESIVLHPDSSYYRTTYPEAFTSFVKKLEEKFELRSYTFGDGFRPGGGLDFSELLTDISGVMSEIGTRYYHRNLGAVIIASDGLYNKGSNPLHVLSGIDAPIYSLALGDTVLQRDILIRRLVYNKVAFTGNVFQLEVQLSANRSKGETLMLTVTSEGQTLYTKPIIPGTDEYSETLLIRLQAGSPGVKRFRAALNVLEGEISRENNIRDFYVEVLENRLKVAIIGLSPHPDMAALKFALESNLNYEVESFMADKFSKAVAAYNLIILHQLPGGNRSHDLLINSIQQAGIPILYIVGKQTQLNALNALKPGISILASKPGFNESLPVFSNDFSLFGLSESTLRTIENLPPLISWFADYKQSPATNVLLRQRIGRVNTPMPLISLMDDARGRSGIILGEGIWKWRMSCFAQHQNHDAFNELMNKIAQYLSLKADRDFFRVSGDYILDENQAVEFNAELYNDNYELVNTPEVSFVIRDSKGKRFNYAFSRRDKDYQLNAGIYPPGEYSWEASTSLGGKQGLKKGRFSISEVQTEKTQTRADHSIMFQLAERTGGELFYPSQLDQLFETLIQRDDILPVYRVRKRLSELIEFKWVFGLLLLLLSAEWVLRKRYGSY
jgi:hypothetical protein